MPSDEVGSPPVRYRVLGPLQIWDGDRDVTPSGDRQRRLVAALLLDRGAVVSADRLADLVWGDDLPSAYTAALQTHVFRLRQVLPPGAIETVGAGYRLTAGDDDVDAARFASLVADAIAARGSDPDRACALLEQAIALCRGEPYESILDTEAGAIEASRLGELEVLAREEHLALRADRAAGTTGGDDLLAELVAFAARYPLRERPSELLMTSLHARGRTPEASRVYDDFRRRLADELGLLPSPELQALHDRLVSGAPRRAAPSEPRGALSSVPRAPNPLVGRDDLISSVVDRVGRVPLVTLIGPGGVGKTRVATEVAHQIERDGQTVWFCELAPADGESVELVVAEAIGVEERAGVSMLRRITDLLASESGLLVLDNCEHVLDDAAALADEVLRRCPNLAVMATSRERLAVDGEHLAPVAPFAVAPDASDRDPALQLFAARATAVDPAFRLDENLDLVADICRRLDGLPLAIELAAARLQSMSIAEVAEGLDARFELLTTGRRTAPRQRSLVAAIGWSYDLLDATTQAAFDTLGVFAGPFRSRGALAVSGLGAVGELSTLVERSLVQRLGDGRYLLLESLKAFAIERLADTGRLEGVRRRHARWVLDEVVAANQRIEREAALAFDDLDDLVAEMRTAHRFMVDAHDADGDIQLVDALAADYAFFRMRPELLAWGEEAALLGDAVGHPGVPNALAAGALGAWKRGDLDEMLLLASRSIDACAARGAPPGLLPANIKGVHAMVTGRLEEAEHWLSIAVGAADGSEHPGQHLVTASDRLLVAAYAKSPDTEALTDALIAAIPAHPTPHGAYAWHAAAEAIMDADPAEARVRAQRSLDQAAATGAWFVTGIAGTLAASIDAREGDVHDAVDAYRWLLPWWRKAGEWSVLWTLLRSMAILLERMGRPRPAAVLLAAVLAPSAGHEVFGDDARRLAGLASRLEPALGDEFAIATEEGRRLGVEEAAALAAAELDAM